MTLQDFVLFGLKAVCHNMEAILLCYEPEKKWAKHAKQHRSAANFFCLCMWQARCKDPTRGHLRELGANASNSIFM